MIALLSRLWTLPALAAAMMTLVICPPATAGAWETSTIPSAASLPPPARTFAQKKKYVLGAPSEDLQAIGPHLMFGYHVAWQLRPLLERGALGGVFIMAHNARRNKTAAGLAKDIAGLRAMAALGAKRPIWIATDQEGGIVSRMSPPLRRPESLRELALSPAASTTEGRSLLIKRKARKKGRQLAELGINVNFAPVVDLRPEKALRRDRATLLMKRAISEDPDTVTAVASDYCQGLISSGVLCTMKHFPGLQKVPADTHLTGAKLTTPPSELENLDWAPFRDTAKAVPTAVMVGHPTLIGVDPGNPASVSKTVINDILRGQLGFDGIVFTDDLAMGAIKKRKGGMPRAAVEALNAGVDVVLVSLDGDGLYDVVYEVLRAWQTGKLDRGMLDASQLRMDRMWRTIQLNRATPLSSGMPLPNPNPRRVSGIAPAVTTGG